MRTPAGKDCRHYFQDFHRGRNVQECRLAKENSASRPWKPQDCGVCPVPDILRANASPNLALTLTIRAKFLGMGRQLDVTATCAKHHLPVEDPFVGCSACNAERPGLDAFLNALEENSGE
jgi:hypothetical protein